GMLFAHCKSQENLPLSAKEEALAYYWTEFSNDITSNLGAIGVGSNIFDNAPEEAYDIVHQNQYTELANRVLQTYTQQAASVVWK
ncbi:MAG TPA: hypothetical protein PLS49_07040, partial [Candidatus Woesebacteria bacterium]|nr:hypothetical protein [Candidatus Woesebacteria bacterium]